MDDRRFDSLTRVFARGGSRRSLIKGLLGLGGIATVGSLAREQDVRAARRPTPTPPAPTCPGHLIPCASGCCCPGGTTQCGAECCPNGQAECCDGACCYGTCYGEELCCGGSNPVCTVDGCCSGVCVDNDQFCCRPGAVCGDACCHDTERCCTAGLGAPVCRPAGDCCVDTECIGGICDNGRCIPYTPTPQPTPTNTATAPTPVSANTPTATPAQPVSIEFSPAAPGTCQPTIVLTGFEPNANYNLTGNVIFPELGQGSGFFMQVTTDANGSLVVPLAYNLKKGVDTIEAEVGSNSTGTLLSDC